MNRTACPVRRPPRRRLVQPETKRETPTPQPQFAYGRPFWLTYASNLTVMVAVALLFRYADFITLLGGTEFHLGWIVGVGMVGSLATRLVLGSSIDRYGTRLIWLGSTLLLVAVCFAHLAVASYTGLAVYTLRILFCCAVAGIYGASITFISTGGPTERMAELVGMLGTAGFLGVVVGTCLGDYLLGSVTVDRGQVTLMFVAAGLLALLSFPFAWLASRTEARREPVAAYPMWSVLRRYQPGPVLLIGAAMGVGLGLPQTFLRTYAAELTIPRIGLFFLVYAATAIATRVVTRRWPERFGTRPIILLGMVGLVASLATFLLVRAEWHLALPAIGFGCSHAILFPSVVAAGSAAFPLRHRGLATILVLASWDLGQLAAAPTAGAVLRYSETTGLPPYPTMFLTIAGLLALIGLWYAIMGRERSPVAMADAE